jgi:hypothetical protein
MNMYNLYALLDPSINDIYSTKFEIASNISKSSFICFHFALFPIMKIVIMVRF